MSTVSLHVEFMHSIARHCSENDPDPLSSAMNNSGDSLSRTVSFRSMTRYCLKPSQSVAAPLPPSHRSYHATCPLLNTWYSFCAFDRHPPASISRTLSRRLYARGATAHIQPSNTLPDPTPLGKRCPIPLPYRTQQRQLQGQRLRHRPIAYPPLLHHTFEEACVMVPPVIIISVVGREGVQENHCRLWRWRRRQPCLRSLESLPASSTGSDGAHGS